jgi:hypothetical protein
MQGAVRARYPVLPFVLPATGNLAQTKFVREQKLGRARRCAERSFRPVGMVTTRDETLLRAPLTHGGAGLPKSATGAYGICHRGGTRLSASVTTLDCTAQGPSSARAHILLSSPLPVPLDYTQHMRRFESFIEAAASSSATRKLVLGVSVANSWCAKRFNRVATDRKAGLFGRCTPEGQLSGNDFFATEVRDGSRTATRSLALSGSKEQAAAVVPTHSPRRQETATGCIRCTYLFNRLQCARARCRSTNLMLPRAHSSCFKGSRFGHSTRAVPSLMREGSAAIQGGHCERTVAPRGAEGDSF